MDNCFDKFESYFQKPGHASAPVIPVLIIETSENTPMKLTYYHDRIEKIIEHFATSRGYKIEFSNDPNLYLAKLENIINAVKKSPFCPATASLAQLSKITSWREFYNELTKIIAPRGAEKNFPLTMLLPTSGSA